MLCGISNLFRLLFPSERQVTHALLTRPPLGYPKASSQITPFDLHVLGTPPAFILSQDQTLMLKWCLCPASFIWHCLLLIRVACQSFDQLACSWISLKILEFSGLHYCLFVKDHNLWLRKSCVALPLFSATALIVYHNHFCLSTTFFKFFWLFYNSQRRRRDLNPRAAINDLHPFQGCPFNLLGTSPDSWF